jgi:hypothetical protein
MTQSTTSEAHGTVAGGPDVRPRAVAARHRRRLALLVTTLTAAAGAWLIGSSVATPTRDADLARLLLAMGVIKAGLAAGAALLVGWRLGRAVRPALLVAYLAAVAALVVATTLILLQARVPLAALLFHAGLLTLLVGAWRDDGLRTGRLERRH